MDTVQYLLEEYKSWTINSDALAEITHMESAKCVTNAISAGRFPIPTYRANGRRVADVRAVAAYLDKQHEDAVKAHEAEQQRLRRAS